MMTFLAVNVVVLVLDARENVSDQDAHLAGYVEEAGRAFVISLNKWDGLSAAQRQSATDSLARTLNLADPRMDTSGD